MTARVHAAALALFAILTLAIPAAAQTGRASGIVRDQNGKPIRGAVINADNPAAYPRQVTSTTDDKGRWAMLGLGTAGEWHFTVQAPGFASQSLNLQVRTAAMPPIQVTLGRDPGPMPGALDKNIQQQIAEATALRDQGRLDQALNAYQDIHKKNEKLTSIHFLLADTLRRKAAAERDPAARRALLDQAIASYDELLKSDLTNERATAERESTRAEISLPPGTPR